MAEELEMLGSLLTEGKVSVLAKRKMSLLAWRKMLTLLAEKMVCCPLAEGELCCL